MLLSDRRDRERDREKDRKRDRERDKDTQKKFSSSFLDSPPHRKDSATTHPSPGTSSRRSTFDSALDSAGATKRGRSPALSSSSDQLERLRKDNYRPPHLPARPPSHSRDRARQGDLPTKLPPPASHVPDLAAALRSPILPPEPPRPPPMQPPPPSSQVPGVPKVPSFVSNQQTASSTAAVSKGPKELSMDEQRLAWHERIECVHIIPLLVHCLTCLAQPHVYIDHIASRL